MKPCSNCKSMISEKETICPYCNAPQFDTMEREKKILNPHLVAILLTAVICVPIIWLCGDHKKDNSNKPKSSEAKTTLNTSSDKIKEPESKTAVETSETESTSTEYSATETETKKAIDDCFDIVETATYQNSIGTTFLIEKIYGKEDITVNRTIILKNSFGDVIGKESDTIDIVKDRYNYFEYRFDAEISDDTEMNITTKEDRGMKKGDRDAVELIAYNQDNYHLYLTFRQVENNVEFFSEYKLLFYKDGNIVDTYAGMFSYSVENMTQKGDEDVAEISVFTDYDELEYIYEP